MSLRNPRPFCVGYSPMPLRTLDARVCLGGPGSYSRSLLKDLRFTFDVPLILLPPTHSYKILSPRVSQVSSVRFVPYR